MLQDPPDPESCRLLILRDAKPFAGEVSGLFDPGVGIVRKLGLEQTTARKDRQGYHVRSLGAGNEVRRYRHFRHLELVKLKLPPKRLGWMGVGGNQLDAFILKRSIHERRDPLVECGNKG